MKTLLLVALVLSTLLIGCATQTEQPPAPEQLQPTADATLQEVDNSVIADNDSVEIGEMI